MRCVPIGIWARDAAEASAAARADAALIPLRWCMAVLACRPFGESARQPRPARYWPDDVPLLAEALLGGVGGA